MLIGNRKIAGLTPTPISQNRKPDPNTNLVHRSQSGCLPWLGTLECRHSNSRGGVQRCKSKLCCFQHVVVVVPALAFAPFGMPTTAFWIYVCASVLFIIGLIKNYWELP